jgi:hypothetical protein
MRTALESLLTDPRRGRRARCRFLALALTLSLHGAAAPRPAHATEPNADALIVQGLELRRQGQAAEALVLFQKAHALEPTPRTSGQLGLVEASLQRWLDADTHLSTALESPAEPWVSSNRKLLDKALLVTQQHIGELLVEGPPGAHVFVSGRGGSKVLPLTSPIRVAEGEARVSAIAPGFKQSIQVVRIQAGKRTSLTLKLIPNPPPAAPSPASRAPARL